jgi:hypothetical protein
MYFQIWVRHKDWITPFSSVDFVSGFDMTVHLFYFLVSNSA